MSKRFSIGDSSFLQSDVWLDPITDIVFVRVCLWTQEIVEDGEKVYSKLGVIVRITMELLYQIAEGAEFPIASINAKDIKMTRWKEIIKEENSET